MADTSILREYLVSLGFKVDQSGNKKFVNTLGSLSLNAFTLTKNIEAAAKAIKAMVTDFASAMEKLYYSSRRAESTVQQMQALEFAAKQVGVNGETMKGSIEGMARAMRANPGLQGLLTNLGVPTKGRTVAQEMVDMVKQLRKLPFAIGSRYAEMFGMDADTYLMLSQNVDKLEEAAKLRESMNKDAGLDTEDAAKKSTEFMQDLNVIAAQFETIWGSISNDLMPYMIAGAHEIIGILDTAIKFLGAIHHMKPAEHHALAAQGANEVGALDFGEDTPAAPVTPAAPGAKPAAAPAPAQAPAVAAMKSSFASQSKAAKLEKLAALEKKYNLPAGILSSMWQQESGQGKNLYNKKSGAKGDFQFMDPTAKEFGVDTNSFDSSADGAARKLAGEMKAYHGDANQALQAYNLGEGNLRKVHLGRKAMPAETAKYGQEILARAGITQTNNITVNGVQDPDKAAAAVKDSVQLANADLIRSGKTKVF